MAEFRFNIGAWGGGREKGLTSTISVPEKTTTTKKKKLQCLFVIATYSYGIQPMLMNLE